MMLSKVINTITITSTYFLQKNIWRNISFKLSLIFFFSSFLLSCNTNEQQEKKKVRMPSEKEMIKINQHLVEEDELVIQRYIDRRNWEMKKKESGLYYMIYKNGKGPSVQKDDIVTINFKVELLDGTVCYHSREEGPLTFKVGHGGVETGLEEGIRLLQEGDKAKFIMPPHLAHGLIGDEKCIPGRSTIVYDLEVIGVQKSK